MEKEEKNVWLRSKMKREDIVKAISKDAIEALCREYDIEEGEYPKHDYEGCAIYNYFCWMKDVEEESTAHTHKVADQEGVEKMKIEGIAELKELDRIVQECTEIKRERDKLQEDKEYLERELQKIKNVEPYMAEVIKERDTLRVLLRRIGHVDIRTRTIDKGDLEKALKQFYKYEAVQIEKVCVGSPDTATCVYPQKTDPRLLLKVDILFEVKDEGEE